MRERDVEQALIRAVRKAGGMCLKFVSPGWDGAPDRMCLFFPGKIAFVELKAPGKRPRPLQEARHRQLEQLGFPVYVIDRKEEIASLLERMSVAQMSAAKPGGGADA